MVSDVNEVYIDQDWTTPSIIRFAKQAVELFSLIRRNQITE